MNTLEMNLATVTEAIWGSLLGLRIAPQRDPVYATNFERDLFAQVEIEGAFHGVVTLRCPEPLARRVAATMFSKAPEEIDEQSLIDAVGEVVNVTAGNLKLLLPSPSRVMIPKTCLGFALVPGQCSSVQEIRFECGDCYFAVSIFERI